VQLVISFRNSTVVTDIYGLKVMSFLKREVLPMSLAARNVPNHMGEENTRGRVAVNWGTRLWGAGGLAGMS
jgi:hypothetical protein